MLPIKRMESVRPGSAQVMLDRSWFSRYRYAVERMSELNVYVA